MRIIEYVCSLGDGGAETLVKDYAILLSRLGHEVTVLVVFPPSDTANYRTLKQNNISVESVFDKLSFPNRIQNRFFKKYIYRLKLKGIIGRLRPDVIHVHLGLLETLAAADQYLDKIRLLYTCHNLPQYFLGENCPKEREAAMLLIAHHDLQIIALHDDMRKEINQMLGIDNTVVVNNGIDFARFCNVVEPKEAIRATLGIAKEAFVVGHIGRFSEQKNHPFLVDVFAEVKKLNPEAHLLLVGVGETKHMIEDKLKKMGLYSDTTFLQARTDTPRLYKAMDIFVFPSIFEGLGNVIVEAQISKIRCIISDVIPSAAIMSPQTIPLSLDLSPAEWAKEIVYPSRVNLHYGDLSQFDMNDIIHQLEELYK